MSLNYERRGRGEPLVLIHGTGSHLRTWDPVLDRLATERDLITVDLPGHGGSPRMRPGKPPTAAGFAREVAAFLKAEFGLESAHLAGNSMGGWTALEMAKLGRARSVTGLCPAGLWRGRTPRYCVASLRSSRATARLLGRRGARLATSTGVGRTLLMGQIFGRPWKMPAGAAEAALRAIAEAPGFDEHLEAAKPERFRDGWGIEVPVTVAWGTRDLLLLPGQSRHGDELPPRTRWLALPGCGHVPMHDDPELVAQTILDGSRGSRGPAFTDPGIR